MSTGGEREDPKGERRLLRADLLIDAGIAGLSGALVSSVPHTLLDLVAGEPLRTPLTLYGALIGTRGSPMTEALLYTGVHLAVWCVIGFVLAVAIKVVDVRPTFGTGTLFLTLLGLCTAVSLASALSGNAELGLPVWIGTAVGAVAALVSLVVRHRSVLDFELRRDLTHTTRCDLELAYREERRALELWRAARIERAHSRWLAVQEAQAERNVEQIEALFERFGLRRPEVDPAPTVPLERGLDAIKAEAAELTAGRRALYDRFLVVVDEPIVQTLFERLRFVAERSMAENRDASQPGGAAWAPDYARERDPQSPLPRRI